jgi:hypothetical protein
MERRREAPSRWSFLVSAAAPAGAAPKCRLLVVSARELVLLAPVSGRATLRAPLAAVVGVSREGSAGEARAVRLVLELQLDSAGEGASAGRATELAVAPLRAGDADALLLSLFQPAAVRLVRGKERAAFEHGSDAASVLAALRAKVLAATRVTVEPSLAYVLDGVTTQAEDASAASLSLGECDLSLARGGIELLRYPLTQLGRVHLLERGLVLLAFKDGRLLGLRIVDDALLFLLTLLGRAAAQDLDDNGSLLDGPLGWLQEHAEEQRLPWHQPPPQQTHARASWTGPPLRSPASPAALDTTSGQRLSYKERQARQRSESAEHVLEDARKLLAKSAAKTSQGRAQVGGEGAERDTLPAEPSMLRHAQKAVPRAQANTEERALSPAGASVELDCVEPVSEGRASVRTAEESDVNAAQPDAGIASAPRAALTSNLRRKRGSCKQQ